MEMVTLRNMATKLKMFFSFNIYANPLCRFFTLRHRTFPAMVAFFVPCHRTPLSALDPPLSFYGYVNSDLKSDFRGAERPRAKEDS